MGVWEIGDHQFCIFVGDVRLLCFEEWVDANKLCSVGVRRPVTDYGLAMLPVGGRGIAVCGRMPSGAGWSCTVAGPSRTSNSVSSDLVFIPQSTLSKCPNQRIVRVRKPTCTRSKACKTPIYKTLSPVNGGLCGRQSFSCQCSRFVLYMCISGNCTPSFSHCVYVIILMLGGEGVRDA